MDFRLTDEQQMLREGAERFLEESYPFERRRETLRTSTRCDEQIWQTFAELGWLALTVPEDAGGLGAGMIEASLIAEAMGRRLVVEPYASTALLCARIIERADDRTACEELLGEIATGATRVALACLEVGRRYQFDAPSTVARPVGDGFVLRGRKVLAVDAPAAHRLIVTATLDGAGFALFLLDPTASGITLQSYPLIDGRGASDVELAEVAVPRAAMLCGITSAAQILDEAIDRYSVFQVADALGAMEAVMEQTAEHLRNRRQFGRALATFQALQHRMAEMFVEIQEVRSALFHALAHLDDRPAERNAAVSSAKVVAIEAGRVVGGQGIQLHGGVGMTEEYQVGHYFKRLLAQEKAFGDLDYHLDRIARTYR